jgi:hypothetical protein
MTTIHAQPPLRLTIAVAHPWVRRCTRVGFVARGILYLLIGLLTLWSILRDGERAHGGMTVTFDSIHSVRPGIVLLAGLAIGFAGFALGMMWTAIFDWNNDGKTMLGLSRRIGTFIGGLGHISLMASALLLIAGREPEGHGTRKAAEIALGYPFGREGVAIAGAWAIGYGVFLLSKVWTGRLDLLLDLSAMNPAAARITDWLGRLGMFSRGLIYVTIGTVLVIAAWVGNAQNVVGFGGAMRTVSDNGFGVASLAVIAVGLAAYGIFMFIEARYRRIGDSASPGL